LPPTDGGEPTHASCFVCVCVCLCQ
jgi:hypothetical protein